MCVKFVLSFTIENVFFFAITEKSEAVYLGFEELSILPGNNSVAILCCV